jgi:CTP synthase
MTSTKFIFIMGTVISGLGKGVATASIGKILQEYGYTVTATKVDPYINTSASGLNPKEHGEVFVTNDGGEIDQDAGNYERFLNIELSKKNSITTGQIYKSVIDKEQDGYFSGETVQFIPHITNEIKERIVDAGNGKDIMLVEIGGIVGDFENQAFLLAAKSLEIDIGKENILYVLVSYMLIPSHINQMKTKPTQTGIRALMEFGIFPDIILCRGKEPVDEPCKKKIETYANIKKEFIISAPDTDNIYKVPLILEKENIGQKILTKLNLKPKRTPLWENWIRLINNISNPLKTVKIAIIGKYLDSGNYQITDSYISVNEAFKHVSANLAVKINIDWISSININEASISILSNYDGICVPGGFGETGVNGIILSIQYARTKNIPFLGLCYGLQLAVVEYAKNVCGLIDAHTTEVNKETKNPVIDIMDDQKDKKIKRGTLRCGIYPCITDENTLVHKLYRDHGRIIGKNILYERHRHRYEVNPKYTDLLENAGLVFSGHFLDAKNIKLIEFLELPTHRFFVATQAHPEFTSNLLKPSPLFSGFIKSCLKI